MSAQPTSNNNVLFATLGGVVSLGAIATAYMGLSHRRHSPPIAHPLLSVDMTIDWNSGRAIKAEFCRVYDEVKMVFLEYCTTELQMPADALARMERMIDHTVPGGKNNRGITVVMATRELCGAQFNEATASQAFALGWAIELLQACFLVADDLMDLSVTRRGKPCWYKMESVGNDAVNDAFILESFVYFLIKRHTKSFPYYGEVVDVFHEVALKTEMGQLLDAMSAPQGKRGKEVLEGFTMERYLKIIDYKTAYYTFYLSLACAMLIAGHGSSKKLDAARRISIKFGQKFQIQDDYLDCFGDPEVLGKIGTDIVDHKCSWLVVRALEKCTPEQRLIIDTHYGKAGDDEQKIKELYSQLQLEDDYLVQDEQRYAELQQMVASPDFDFGKTTFSRLLGLLHKRKN